MYRSHWKKAICALGIALASGAAGTAAADEPVIRFTSAEVYVSGVETTEPWRTVAVRQPEIIAPDSMPDILVETPSADEYYLDGEPYQYGQTTSTGACTCEQCCGTKHFLDIDFWLDGGAALNSDSPASHYNGPVTFDDRDDGQFNQVYLSVGHDADNGGCGFAVGGRVDFLFGTDSRFTTSYGLEDAWNQAHRFYGLAAPQAYAEVALNDLTVKLGHYYTIIGYEVVPAPDNFFYSHAYTMQYGEPFTHTGALASYAASDRLTLNGGFDRGWDKWEDDNHSLSFLGGATWDSGCGFSVAYAFSLGDEASANDADVFGDRYMHSIVISSELTDRVTYVVQSDLGHQNNGVDLGEDAEWYGVNQYLLCKVNCCWSAGARFEWFRDDDGVRVTGVDSANPIYGQQFAGNFYEVTLGLNYTPTDRLTVRPELRYDWFDGTGTSQPYDDGNKDDQFTAALDAIWTY